MSTNGAQSHLARNYECKITESQISTKRMKGKLNKDSNIAIPHNNSSNILMSVPSLAVLVILHILIMSVSYNALIYSY